MNELNPSYFFDLQNYQHSILFSEINFVWEALDQIDKYLANTSLGQIESEIPSQCYLEDTHLISIGKNTVIEAGAFIRGPCIIGNNCTIRQGAYIRGNLITGDHCVIGHTTEVKNAIFLNHTHAAHFAYVGDSILGNHVNLGAGTKCANLKFNNSEISLEVNGKRITTGRRKLGAIVGDRAQLGCNSVTNPGTFLGKEVFCYPTVNVGGFVPSFSQIKRKEELIVVNSN